MKGVKKYLTLVLLFSEINPRSVRHVNIDMEGYAVGIDSKGQLFCSVTTSNYPFSYVDDRYNVCSSNTIFLKTNLNNIAVANNSILATTAVYSDIEPSLRKAIGGLQGAMPSGHFEHRSVTLHGIDGQVIATGYKDLVTEDSIMIAAFTRYLRTHVYKLNGPCLPLQHTNLNVIDLDTLTRFNKENTDVVDRSKHFEIFKDKFIQSQLTTFNSMKDSTTFYRLLSTVC